MINKGNIIFRRAHQLRDYKVRCLVALEQLQAMNDSDADWGDMGNDLYEMAQLDAKVRCLKFAIKFNETRNHLERVMDMLTHDKRMEMRDRYSRLMEAPVSYCQWSNLEITLELKKCKNALDKLTRESITRLTLK